jgi:hypothetical protein
MHPCQLRRLLRVALLINADGINPYPRKLLGQDLLKVYDCIVEILPDFKGPSVA